MADEAGVSQPTERVHVGDAAGEAGESIHLPGPSYLPVVVAGALTLAIVGVVLFPVMAVIGLVITVIAVVRWIRETRAEISELPLEH